ncbi:MAG: hypothetical protein DRP09_21405 [Candidatus Thorarchaeota archaeon]|nr:MAG: hypothetical protein DRP09_21405 [Candidatus Thorarchaeota archaeon]
MSIKIQVIIEKDKHRWVIVKSDNNDVIIKEEYFFDDGWHCVDSITITPEMYRVLKQFFEEGKDD